MRLRASLSSQTHVNTGAASGGCSGYVIDLKEPLKRGGADDPGSMQWQTVEDSKVKDKWE